MQIFRVGGAVRDRLLQLPSKDNDYVVVGANVEDMLARGFEPVGKDFPVFLHPQTREEYALARTERKVSQGYRGFEFYTAADLTIEDDLLRRDLTINAIAEDSQGNIIDPFHGVADLKQRILRHVSPAFAEDPVRILRTARFAARFAYLGFRVADETMALMRQMVENGEVDALVAERVWKELEGALLEKDPQVFFRVLRDCGALKRLFPEIERLYGVPQTAQWHPEIDTGVHTMMVLQQAVRLTENPALSEKETALDACEKVLIRFAALVHDLGKALTPRDQWPRHRQHEQLGLRPLRAMCQRLKVPNKISRFAHLFTEHHLLYHRAFELKASTLVSLFNKLDGFRQPQNIEYFILTGEADSRGRKGFEEQHPMQSDYLRAVFQQLQMIDAKPIIAAGYRGQQISEQLYQQRCQRCAQIKKQWMAQND